MIRLTLARGPLFPYRTERPAAASCSCGCGRTVPRGRKTALPACHRWQMRRGGRASGAQHAAKQYARRLAFLATHGTLDQRLHARAQQGRLERERQQRLEGVAVPAGHEVAA